MLDETLYILVRSIVEDMGYIPLEIMFLRSKSKYTLKVVIHHQDKSVGSEECTEIADVLSRRLDIEDPIEKRYDLVVESPGLEREIKKNTEYPYFVGKEFKIFLSDDNVYPTKEGFFIGSLLQCENESCVFSIDGKNIVVPFVQIRKARLYYDFQHAFKQNRQEKNKI